MAERQVYIGKNLAGDVLIRGEIGGYAPLITIEVTGTSHTIIFSLSPLASAELSEMLKEASDTVTNG